MATFVSFPSGPAAFLLFTAAMVMVVSAHGVESAWDYEKFGPYYQHDTVSRPNFTNLIVSRGYTSSEGFGSLAVFDDPLTVTPDITSATVARIQGMQAIVSMDGANALITQTLHLPGGSLTYTGVFSVNNKINRFHFVGGTGEFESVIRGKFEIEVFDFSPEQLDAILIVTAYYHKVK